MTHSLGRDMKSGGWLLLSPGEPQSRKLVRSNYSLTQILHFKSGGARSFHLREIVMLLVEIPPPCLPRAVFCAFVLSWGVRAELTHRVDWRRRRRLVAKVRGKERGSASPVERIRVGISGHFGRASPSLFLPLEVLQSRGRRKERRERGALQNITDSKQCAERRTTSNLLFIAHEVPFVRKWIR